MTPSKAYRNAWKNVISGWRRITGRPIGEYCYGVGTYAITKGIEGRYMGDFIKLLGEDMGNEYIFFDAGHNNQFYYSYYPAYRAMWNPDFNVQAALDEHWALLYGPEAGKYLQEFYELVYKTWENKLIPLIGDHVSEDYAMRGSVLPKTLYTAFDLKILPYFFYFGAHFLMGDLMPVLQGYADYFMSFRLTLGGFDWLRIGLLGFLVLVLFIPLLAPHLYSFEKSVAVRTKIAMTYNLMLLGIFFLFIGGDPMLHGVFFIALSILFSYNLAYLDHLKWSNVTFIILILAVLASHYVPLFL